MKTIHNSNLLIGLTFLFALILISSCEIESKKITESTSNPNNDEAEKIEANPPFEYEFNQPLNNLKTKDLIYSWVDKLNIRDKASLKSKAIASVDSDAALEFTGVKSGDVETIVLRGVAYEDLWYKVVTEDGEEGWVFGGAVKREGESKGNTPITDTKIAFPHFGNFDLSTWKKINSKTEGGEVDFEIITFEKDNQIMEITSSNMGEMHYGYDYKLKGKDGKIIKERNFSFSGIEKMLEEKVTDYISNIEYSRKQTLKKHWYQLNDKPKLVNGNWTKNEILANTFNLKESILDIKKKFQDIEKNLKSFTKKKTIMEDEGGIVAELIGYYDKDGIPRKVIREEAMGHSAFTYSYYLKEGTMFFIFEQRSSEASLRGPFTFNEKRIYLKDGNIIQLLEKEKTVKGDEDAKLSQVPNKDITNTLKNKSGQIYFNEINKMLKLLADGS